MFWWKPLWNTGQIAGLVSVQASLPVAVGWDRLFLAVVSSNLKSQIIIQSKTNKQTNKQEQHQQHQSGCAYQLTFNSFNDNFSDMTTRTTLGVSVSRESPMMRQKPSLCKSVGALRKPVCFKTPVQPAVPIHLAHRQSKEYKIFQVTLCICRP